MSMVKISRNNNINSNYNSSTFLLHIVHNGSLINAVKYLSSGSNSANRQLQTILTSKLS
jgi:hypothetical protein